MVETPVFTRRVSTRDYLFKKNEQSDLTRDQLKILKAIDAKELI